MHAELKTLLGSYRHLHIILNFTCHDGEENRMAQVRGDPPPRPPARKTAHVGVCHAGTTYIRDSSTPYKTGTKTNKTTNKETGIKQTNIQRNKTDYTTKENSHRRKTKHEQTITNKQERRPRA
jgi:hypothetical protein